MIRGFPEFLDQLTCAREYGNRADAIRFFFFTFGVLFTIFWTFFFDEVPTFPSPFFCLFSCLFWFILHFGDSFSVPFINESQLYFRTRKDLGGCRLLGLAEN